VWLIYGDYQGIHVSEDSVFVYNFETETLDSFNRFTGDLIWQAGDWLPNGINNYIEHDDYYIFENQQSELYLLNKLTGEKLWAYTAPKITYKIDWYLYNDDLYIFDGNELIVYDTTSFEEVPFVEPISEP
jgi:outer membrane protein assembly factor BamB